VEVCLALRAVCFPDVVCWWAWSFVRGFAFAARFAVAFMVRFLAKRKCVF
jgi:hypothetical protein